MTKRGNFERNGLVHLDPDTIQRQMLRLGLTRTELAYKTGMARNTIIKVLRGEGVFPHTALQVATALGFPDVTELLVAPENGEASEDGAGETQLTEWETESYLGPWTTASNGLQFRVCRMQHRFVENRAGRGKWYDLLHLSDRDREKLRVHLIRHPTVCERIGRHPNIAENVSASPVASASAWWVTDRWIDGISLDEVVRRKGAFPHKLLPQLMRDLALGLQALHKAEVVFRELAPSRVIIAKEDGRAVLTDFELAKLLDGKPTVSADWPDDPYRAPEVKSGSADVSSDLYSWARVLLFCATGEPPPEGEDSETLAGLDLPKAVWRVAQDCLSPSPSERPKRVRELVLSLEGWPR